MKKREKGMPNVKLSHKVGAGLGSIMLASSMTMIPATSAVADDVLFNDVVSGTTTSGVFSAMYQYDVVSPGGSIISHSGADTLYLAGDSALTIRNTSLDSNVMYVLYSSMFKSQAPLVLQPGEVGMLMLLSDKPDQPVFDEMILIMDQTHRRGTILTVKYGQEMPSVTPGVIEPAEPADPSPAPGVKPVDPPAQVPPIGGVFVPDPDVVAGDNAASAPAEPDAVSDMVKDLVDRVVSSGSSRMTAGELASAFGDLASHSSVAGAVMDALNSTNSDDDAVTTPMPTPGEIQQPEAQLPPADKPSSGQPVATPGNSDSVVGGDSQQGNGSDQGVVRNVTVPAPIEIAGAAQPTEPTAFADAATDTSDASQIEAAAVASNGTKPFKTYSATSKDANDAKVASSDNGASDSKSTASQASQTNGDASNGAFDFFEWLGGIWSWFLSLFGVK